MFRKITAVVIILSILATATVFSAEQPFKSDYSAGESTYNLESKYCEASEGVSVTETGIVISPGKTATYNFYLPFNARSMTIQYKGASESLKINSGYREYNINTSGDGEATIVFRENLGYDIQKYFYLHSIYAEREFVEHIGERTFSFTSTGGITIESIVFEKEKVPVIYNIKTGEHYQRLLPDVSENVLDTVSTVLMDTEAPIIVVNGGKRYVNNNNLTEKPLLENGTLYLPINTLAKALGYYCEDIPEKSYAMLRDDVNEYVLMENRATLCTNNGEKQILPDSAIIYRDGKAWGEVRYFAELAGNTVGYKDGLVAIDDKYTVARIMDGDLNSYGKSLFADFKQNLVTGREYHVAQTANASDSNDGSISAPYKTISKAASVAKAGDTVLIHEGIYRETLSPSNNGSANMPITFRNYNGERVLISANDQLGGFSHHKDNIYKTTMNWDLTDGRNQIFIGEESMVEARYPNDPSWKSSGLSDMWTVKGDFQVTKEDNSVITSDTLLNQDEDNIWAGGTYVGVFGTAYALSTAKITSSTKGQMTIDKTTATTKWWPDMSTSTSIDNGWNFGCIIGTMAALDTEKEWVKDGNTLYMIFPQGKDPLTTKVEAKARQRVIDLTGKQYINIYGIDTIGGGVTMKNSTMCMLNGMDMKYISHYTLTNDQRDGYIDWPFNTKNDNGAPQRGEVGIYVGGTDNAVVNCTIDQSAGAGLYITGLYSYIENNVLSDCGYMGSYVSGININTAGADSKTTPRGGYGIYNNTVYNCGRSCLNVSNNESASHSFAPYLPMEIAYNDFHDGTLTTLDTGITYEYFISRGLDRQKTMFHHNYIYTTATTADANPYTMALYHDGGSQGAETFNNLVFATNKDVGFKHYIFQQQAHHAPAYNDVYNNSCFSADLTSVAELEAKHFPQGQMFYAGAKKGDYLVNYNRAKAQEETLEYSAKNAKLFGATLENGIIRFTENGQYVCFEDVDFGSGADVLSLTVYGDKYYSCDVIEVTVGETIDENPWVTRTVQVNSPHFESADNIELGVGFQKGKTNVYIKMSDYKSLAIGGISVVKLTEKGAQEGAYSVRKYGDDLTSYTAGREGSPPTLAQNNSDGTLRYHIKDTWSGTILNFENVKFRENTNQLVLAVSSGGGYTGQVITVHIDDPDSEAIATYTVDKTDWSDYSPVTIDLAKTISAGTHSVHFKFSEYGTSNFYYFGFLAGVQ